jgi:aspartate aminotransferase
MVINGVSKLYGMTGFRIGWVVGEQGAVDVMINVQAQTTSCTSACLQAAAEGRAHRSAERRREPAADAREQPQRHDAGAGSFEGVKVTKPDGTFYCLPDFSAYSKDSVELSKMLLEEGRWSSPSRARSSGWKATCA